jgi:hydrogenase expression/formation protein HypD
MRVPASTGPVADEGQGARRRHPHGLFAPPTRWTLARKNPDREVVFFAIGFETTTPPTALVIRQARPKAAANFSVLCCHVLTPSAITHILESPEVRQYGTVPIDGFIGPAHVSIIIGSGPTSTSPRSTASRW